MADVIAQSRLLVFTTPEDAKLVAKAPLWLMRLRPRPSGLNWFDAFSPLLVIAAVACFFCIAATAGTVFAATTAFCVLVGFVVGFAAVGFGVGAGFAGAFAAGFVVGRLGFVVIWGAFR